MSLHNYTKHINAICAQMSRFLNVTASGINMKKCFKRLNVEMKPVEETLQL